MELYVAIAMALGNLEENGKIKTSAFKLTDWEEVLQRLTEHLPSGSGFDAGCEINEKSHSEKIIIDFAYHVMNENGYYDGWISCQAIVTPSLTADFDLHINWRGYRRKYKELCYEYFYDTFYNALNDEVNWIDIQKDLQNSL